MNTDRPVAGFSEKPGHLVNRASRLMMRYGEVRMQPLGLGVAAFPVLMLLRGGTAMRQRELSICARLEQPSMAQLLARLERDGMIRRAPDPADGRASLISLTEKAEALLPEVDAIVASAHEVALRGMSADEVQDFARLLQRMVANLESDSGD